MKPDGFRWVSSAAATVYSVAITSSTTSVTSPPFLEEKASVTAKAAADGSGKREELGSGKFAPRFDGLRFIETLVTAHR